jgi:glycosyltransferase involved in cell wall biosynthesis
MKVKHVTFSSTGGAGIVACRMVRAQRDMGIDSTLLTVVGGAVGVRTIAHPKLFISAMFDFFILRKSRLAPLFSRYRTPSAAITAQLIKYDGVVHLHWTPGAVNMEELLQTTDRHGGCVWTLHDMWAFTGGCHHSLDCLHYSEKCQSCPQVRSVFQSSIQKHFERKKNLYADTKNLRIVCPSNWLKERADRSGVFQSSEVSVIHNPVPPEYFLSFRSQQDVDTGQTKDLVVCFVANDVADPNKNLGTVIEIIDKANQKLVNSDSRVILKVIGNGSLQTTSPCVQFLGPIEDSEKMAKLISETDLMVNYSEAENFPNVIAESLACGTPVIGRNVGGIPELITDGETGHLVSSPAEVIECLLSLHADRKTLQQMSNNSYLWACQNLEENAIMKKYAELYLSLEKQ